MFQEKQRFNQWWVWAIIYVVTLLPLVTMFYQSYTGLPFGNKPMTNKGLSLVFIPLLGLTLFLRSLRLTTTIDSDNIDFYFSPLVKKKHTMGKSCFCKSDRLRFYWWLGN